MTTHPLRALRRILPVDRVSAIPADTDAYRRDLWPLLLHGGRSGHLPTSPVAVVWPDTTEELVRVVRLAKNLDLSIVPFGAGSGVAGGTMPLGQSLMVDMKRLDRILEIDPVRRLLRSEVGILGEVLERKLQQQGLTLGHFPSSIFCSTLGGWLATRSAGQLSTRYGKIEDMVRSVRGVLPNGEIIDTRQIESVLPGLDASGLLVGSEGTLALLTEAVLHLHPLPASHAHAAYRFHRTEGGIETIREILASGIRPAAVRLYDPLDTLMVASGKTDGASDAKSSRSLLREVLSGRGSLGPLLFRLLLRSHGAINRLSPRLPGGALLVLRFEGEPEVVEADHDQARRVALAFGATDLGPEPANHWWSHRYDVSYKQSPVIDRGGLVDTMEIAATWDRLTEVYQRVRHALGREALVLAHFSHAYPSGCAIYFTFCFPATSWPRTRDRYMRIWSRALEATRLAGGTTSHHHGVGILKRRQAALERSQEFALLEKVARAFDPENQMNPGKLFSSAERTIPVVN